MKHITELVQKNEAIESILVNVFIYFHLISQTLFFLTLRTEQAS